MIVFRYFKYLILSLLLSCSEGITDTNYVYTLTGVPDNACTKISGDMYSIKIDTSNLQTFTKFRINTDNSNAKYVNWSWTASDTVYTIVSGVNYGPMVPTNLSSHLTNGEGYAMFGFHKLMIGDTIRVKGLFIDSKILTNYLSEKRIVFVVIKK